MTDLKRERLPMEWGSITICYFRNSLESDCPISIIFPGVLGNDKHYRPHTTGAIW